MRQQETIRQKVKSVIKISLSVGFLLLFGILPQDGNAQKTPTMNEEHYQIIKSSFNFSTEETIKIYFQTIGYESWMDLLWEEQLYSNDGVGFCSFDDPKLEKSFETLRDLVGNMESQRIDKQKLGIRYKLVKNKKRGGLSLSQVIIIGNYSFIFRKSIKTKSVYVQKKSIEGNWEPECVVTIYGELH